MTNPTTLSGKDLRDKGMQQAIDHANEVSSDWSERAYLMLIKYTNLIGLGETFKTEDFRQYAESKGLETPPSLRAYGPIIVRAAKVSLIAKNGYGQVENKKAHRANCCVWSVV